MPGRSTHNAIRDRLREDIDREGVMPTIELPIHSDPDIMGGTPVFVGTRVPVNTLLDYLEAGDPRLHRRVGREKARDVLRTEGARDHHVHLPNATLGLGRRRHVAEVLRGSW